MEWEMVLMIIQSVSVLLAIVISLGTIRRRDRDDGAATAEIRANITHIKDTMDGMAGFGARITGLEESTKSAHKRMDEHVGTFHKKGV